MTDIQALAEAGELPGFAHEEEDIDYGTAWDIVDTYLTEEYGVTEFWQHRALTEDPEFMAGFVNGVVWTATYYPDEFGWGFDFCTYSEYEEYYN